MKTTEKIIIYQIFTRLFGNTNGRCIQNGPIGQNGCGKMDDITKQVLHEIKNLGATTYGTPDSWRTPHKQTTAATESQETTLRL